MKLKKTVVPERKAFVDRGEALAAAVEACSSAPAPPVAKTEAEWRELLSAEEYAVLFGKGTDAAHSGEYIGVAPAEGHFACRACQQPLYSAGAKFESGCGWPAFDRCYAGAIRMALDASHGLRRVELVCTGCDGHLGHVFVGEKHTATDERHCVNSSSIRFVKQPPATCSDEIRLAETVKLQK